MQHFYVVQPCQIAHAQERSRDFEQEDASPRINKSQQNNNLDLFCCVATRDCDDMSRLKPGARVIPGACPAAMMGKTRRCFAGPAALGSLDAVRSVAKECEGRRIGVPRRRMMRRAPARPGPGGAKRMRAARRASLWSALSFHSAKRKARPRRQTGSAQFHSCADLTGSIRRWSCPSRPAYPRDRRADRGSMRHRNAPADRRKWG